MGRFINEDPLRFTAGPNFYAYVANSPTNFVDPSGTIGPVVVVGGALVVGGVIAYNVSPTFQARVDAFVSSVLSNVGFPYNTGSVAEALVHSPEFMETGLTAYDRRMSDNAAACAGRAFDPACTAILEAMKNYCSSRFAVGTSSAATCAALEEDFEKLEKPECP